MAHTVLQVPVPGLEPFVRARTVHYDADYLSADPDFTHAHVTVLGPFLPILDEAAANRIAAIAADIEPFDFRLDRVDRFSDGCIHLVPDPRDSFDELTRPLAEQFPQCPPYEGRFPDSRPHLTLDLEHGEVTVVSTERLLGKVPRPQVHHAQQIDLAWYEPRHCRRVRTWRLGRV